MGEVSPELVDMVIDHVGNGHRSFRPVTYETATIAYETLKNCALVARSWTYRSHKNLFKAIVLRVRAGEGIRDLVLPPEALLKFVNSLEILVHQGPHRGAITLHLLTAFSVCPLKSLLVSGGLFSLGGRSALSACFNDLSGELLDLTFRFCLFEPEPLRDILAIHNTDASITFFSCDQELLDDPIRNSINWQPVQHKTNRMLCVMGSQDEPNEEFLIDLSELSVQFSRLEVDFYEDGHFPVATQSLIDASAAVVSFLKINVISDASGTFSPLIKLFCRPLTLKLVDMPADDLEVLPPPGLSRCVNLSELVLNLKGSYSCFVQTPATVLATLLDANCSNLSKITVEVEGARPLFLAGGRKERADSWRDFDSTLAALAWRPTNARNKKLVFVMEVTCTDDTICRAKKWLPRLLPRFTEDGSLHVHHGEDDGCDLDEYDVENERACMGRAVLKKYEYKSESDDETEEVEAAEGGKGNEENRGGDGAEGIKAGKEDDGNEGDDEGDGEEETQENE